jgi:hypothetical protein
MGMQRADSTFVKAEGDKHEFRALRENGPPVAGGDLGPDRIICYAKSFTNFRCHGAFITANVR